MTQPIVLVTQPHDGNPKAEARDAFRFASTSGKCQVIPHSPTGGTVQINHNNCWTTMLNNRAGLGLTHFAMIHGDVIAPENWLDALIAEMDEHDADIVSAVIPMRDGRGVTSTGIEDPDYFWGPRRLSLAEVFERPPTFTDPRILLNTGLWVCRIGAWCERVWFTIVDDIVYREDCKQWVLRMMSEDWIFMAKARDLGARCFATRAVEVEHGSPQFHNRAPWGAWKTDRDCAEEALRRGECAGPIARRSDVLRLP